MATVCIYLGITTFNGLHSLSRKYREWESYQISTNCSTNYVRIAGFLVLACWFPLSLLHLDMIQHFLSSVALFLVVKFFLSNTATAHKSPAHASMASIVY